MQAYQEPLSDNYSNLIKKFSEYLLLQRERDQSTAACYGYDARIFLNYRLAMDNIDLPNLFTPDAVAGFVVYLRKRGLHNSTIRRGLIGAMRF